MKHAATHAGTCQVCFRQQKLPGLGLVSLHGYKRPGEGYIVGRCWGSGFAPFEQSCERTRAFLSHVCKLAEEKEAELHRLKDPELPSLTYVFPPYESRRRQEKGLPGVVTVPRGAPATGPSLYDVPSFARILEDRQRQAERDLAALKRHVADLAQRIAGWMPRPLLPLAKNPKEGSA